MQKQTAVISKMSNKQLMLSAFALHYMFCTQTVTVLCGCENTL